MGLLRPGSCLWIVVGILVSTAGTANAKNYVIEKVEILNGKRYITKFVQPFYRVHHEHAKLDLSLTRNDEDAGDESEKVSASDEGPKFRAAKEPPRKGQSTESKRDPSFGIHDLPAEDIKKFVKPEWPEEFALYTHCMDYLCACPFYNGTVFNGTCVLPTGKIMERALRKDFRMYTPEEKRKFEEALNEMKSIGMYNEIGKFHKFGGIHSGPAFLPWHREMIKRLEMAFRKFYPDLGLPYWDSTLDNNLPEEKDSVWFSDDLMGDTDKEGFVVTGKYAYWHTLENKDAILRLLAQEPDGEFFNDGRVDWVIDQTEINRVMAYSNPLVQCLNYTLDDRFIEYSHDYVHYFINGDMFTKYGSSNDPIFFMHHGFIDLIWETWRQKHQTREQRENDYPADRPECAPSYHFRNAKMALLDPFTNIDGCSNKYTDNLYEYAPRPTCTALDLNCRSEFLFCDHVTNEIPKCSAKVKLGGNCSGFEGIEDACYKGKCVKGRCVANEQMKKREKLGKFM